MIFNLGHKLKVMPRRRNIRSSLNSEQIQACSAEFTEFVKRIHLLEELNTKSSNWHNIVQQMTYRLCSLARLQLSLIKNSSA
ncbi:hypothetical protein EUGRSUZ_L00925 [Eucalyptus grandis]|uniref:Uncharacterized protein n=1 Tax=Eucalyptus grandis TaxID=71139 RepID=A0A058ZVB9_EUCGR|nr:hypothetical protein EUGRSUZ_L00925 [Eucalyptus grandis]